MTPSTSSTGSLHNKRWLSTVVSCSFLLLLSASSTLSPSGIFVTAMATSSSTAAASSARKNSNNNNDDKLVLLIHGLDSSSATWNSVLPLLKTSNCFAMDCRGCGDDRRQWQSDDFSCELLVQDVRAYLETNCHFDFDFDETDDTNSSHNKKKNPSLMLLGHSMGARVALAFAAQYPHHVACLIMEDMDIGRRSPPFALVDSSSSAPFQRSFATKQEAVDALHHVGYAPLRVQEWLEQGRLAQQPDGTWWSAVNPDFRRDCYRHVMDTDCGVDQAQQVAKNSDFPIYILVGGPSHTVCRDASLQQMKEIWGPARATVYQDFPPEATHSIHGSHLEDYVERINGILDKL